MFGPLNVPFPSTQPAATRLSGRPPPASVRFPRLIFFYKTTATTGNFRFIYHTVYGRKMPRRQVDDSALEGSIIDVIDFSTLLPGSLCQHNVVRSSVSRFASPVELGRRCAVCISLCLACSRIFLFYIGLSSVLNLKVTAYPRVCGLSHWGDWIGAQEATPGAATRTSISRGYC